MSQELDSIKHQMSSVKNTLNDKKQSIRRLERRVEDISECILGFKEISDFPESVNRNISKVDNNLKDGLQVNNRSGGSSNLNPVKEKYTCDDGKVSAAISKLNAEKTLVNNEINSEKNSVNSLNNQLSSLTERKTQALIDEAKELAKEIF